MSEKKYVMVVDDERDFADNISTIISNDSNYKVITAYSAIEAFDKLKENPAVRLLVLDIKMPEMDGLQFLEKLRLEHSTVGVIILTAFEDREKWEKARKGLVVSYSKKPISEEDLLDKINKFFEGKEQWLIEQARWELLDKEEKYG